MTIQLATVLLESLSFEESPRDLPLNTDAAIDFTLRLDSAESTARLSASTVGGGYRIAVTYAAQFVTPAAQPTRDIVLEAMMTAATVLETYCRDIITHLTLRGRFGPLVVARLDVDALVRQSPNSIRVSVQGPDTAHIGWCVMT